MNVSQTSWVLWGRRAVLLAGFPALLIVGGLLAARRQTAVDDPPPVTPRSLPVATWRLQPASDVQTRRTYTGVLRPRREAELSFDAAERLVELLADDGQTVTAEQVLARLDDRAATARHRELIAQTEAAQAVLREMENGPRQETIAAAEASVAEQRAIMEQSAAMQARREQLIASRAVSEEDLDNATYEAVAAQARLQAAQRRLEELQAGTRDEQLEAQRAVIEQLQAATTLASLHLEDTSLRAPFDGTVSRRYLDEGTFVTAGEPVFRIVDRELEAEIGMPAAQAGRWSPGDRVSVDVEGLAWQATISGVLPELDAATRTRGVILRLQPAEGDSAIARPIAGQVVRLQIQIPTEWQDAYWVPIDALTQSARGMWSLFVVAETETGFAGQRRDVEVLLQEGGLALVRGTLSDAERIVATGAHRLVEGQAITPQAAEGF